jgi:hypothetical protein
MLTPNIGARQMTQRNPEDFLKTQEFVHKSEVILHLEGGVKLHQIRSYRGEDGKYVHVFRNMETKPRPDGNGTITTHHFSDKPLTIKDTHLVNADGMPKKEIIINDGHNNIYDIRISDGEVSVTHNGRRINHEPLASVLEEPFKTSLNEVNPDAEIAGYVNHLVTNHTLYPEAIAQSLQDWVNRAKMMEHGRTR